MNAKLKATAFPLMVLYQEGGRLHSAPATVLKTKLNVLDMPRDSVQAQVLGEATLCFPV